MEQATGEMLVDDKRVLATKWTLPTGSETGHHTHQHDYVVVYLTDGILTVTTPSGEIIEAAVKQHDLTSRPAGVSHNVMNKSHSLIQFIEIELK
jgi:quercetin dioxygenase-like cupin family protein